MSEVEIKLVRDRFPEIILELPRRMEKVRDRSANRLASRARRRAPRLRTAIHYPSFHREPGWLRSSILTDATPDGEMAVNVWQFYGRFQEFGTKHHGAQPFLVPSAVEEEPMLVADVIEELKDL